MINPHKKKIHSYKNNFNSFINLLYAVYFTFALVFAFFGANSSSERSDTSESSNFLAGRFLAAFFGLSSSESSSDHGFFFFLGAAFFSFGAFSEIVVEAHLK